MRSGRRLALVANGLAGPELRAGKNDAAAVWEVLTDPELGAAEKNARFFLPDSTRTIFRDSLEEILDGWDVNDQLILYFSGHGGYKGSQYSLKFFNSDTGDYEDHLYTHILADLEASQVGKAIIIVDACYSGAIAKSEPGLKDGEGPQSLAQAGSQVLEAHEPEEVDFPSGIVAISASSAIQRAREDKAGSHSLFTGLFVDALKTGLWNTPTSGAVIGPSDLVKEINRRVESESQRARYRIDDAASEVWVAVNRSGDTDSAPPTEVERGPRSYTSLDELTLYYQNSTDGQRPVPSSSVDELDWELVELFAEDGLVDVDLSADRETVAGALGLTCAFMDGVLTKSAFLCFARSPQRLYPEAKVICVAGSKTGSRLVRDAFGGPLQRQFEAAFDWISRRVSDVSTFDPASARRNKQADLDLRIVREALANAIVHRDYAIGGSVQVELQSEELLIKNPGGVPGGVDIRDLLTAERSYPNDEAVAVYMSALVAVENIGRGFALFKQYVEEYGESALSLRLKPGPTFEFWLRRNVVGPDVSPVTDLAKPVERVAVTPSRRRSGRAIIDVELYALSSNENELRITDSESLRSRRMPIEELDQIVARVDELYAADSVGLWTFGSRLLTEVGSALYDFVNGVEGFLLDGMSDPRGTTLKISGPESFVRLPWELLNDGRRYFVVDSTARLTAARLVGSHSARPEYEPPNRALRILFMAASPEGVEPVLAYEAEEAMILDSTRSAGAEVVVEESGSLEGLNYLMSAYGHGYFDVLHLTGHSFVENDEPVLLLENDVGQRQLVGVDELAQAIGGAWPSLIFVSGCSTSAISNETVVASVCEGLVRAGASAVIGWAMPVGDMAASMMAALLYGRLAGGSRLDDAIAHAQSRLHAEQSPFWHFLRLYVDSSPLTSLVTPANTPGRDRPRVLPASGEFLDPDTGRIKVAGRDHFVGRRRVIQRCLRTLALPIGSPDGFEGIVIHGMGGLGKSSVASRVLERMPSHQRVVLLARVDETRLVRALTSVDYGSLQVAQEASQILAARDVNLEERLEYLFRGPLNSIPLLIVLDDFENGNLEERQGTFVLLPEIHTIVDSLGRAIRRSNSQSRLILTTRYTFPTPTNSRLRFIGLETLTPNELNKMVESLENLNRNSPVDPLVRVRAIELAGANPRLLEWLDRVVVSDDLDADELLAALEGEVERFAQDELFVARLLELHPQPLRALLARIALVWLPFPDDVVEVLDPPEDWRSLLDTAIGFGLVTSGFEPDSAGALISVPRIVADHVDDVLSESDRRRLSSSAAERLCELWAEK